jgi:putative Holliday junction resolvase
VQEKDTPKTDVFPDISAIPSTGRIVALDPGSKRIGVAVSDKDRIVATPLPMIPRKSWKNLLSTVQAVIEEFDAAALVVGLPLNTDGSESPMSLDARAMASKFKLSLKVPVYLQDERVTTYYARKHLWDRGVSGTDMKKRIDSEAAAIILGDLLDRLSHAK